MGYKKRQPLSVVFVRTMRLELIQANAHYPLKVACLPFHHVRNTLGLQRYAQIYYSQIYFVFFAKSSVMPDRIGHLHSPLGIVD